jgi:hypothetical protein
VAANESQDHGEFRLNNRYDVQCIFWTYVGIFSRDKHVLPQQRTCVAKKWAVFCVSIVKKVSGVEFEAKATNLEISLRVYILRVCVCVCVCGCVY